MQRIKQTDTSKETGNCLQACIAMLLGLNLSEVPNFKDNASQDAVIFRLEKWLRDRYLALVSMKGVYAEEVLTTTKNAYGFAAVKSRRYPTGLHAVVWRGTALAKIRYIIADPDPAVKLPLKGIPLNAVHVYMIVPEAPIK